MHIKYKKVRIWFNSFKDQVGHRRWAQRVTLFFLRSESHYLFFWEERVTLLGPHNKHQYRTLCYYCGHTSTLFRLANTHQSWIMFRLRHIWSRSVKNASIQELFPNCETHLSTCQLGLWCIKHSFFLLHIYDIQWLLEESGEISFPLQKRHTEKEFHNARYKEKSFRWINCSTLENTEETQQTSVGLHQLASRRPTNIMAVE
jgi:hypothetical protein